MKIKKIFHGVYKLFGIVLMLLSVCTFAVEPHTSDVIAQASSQGLDIYKSQSCSCCKGWVKSIDAYGFKTVIHESDNLASIKDQYAIASQYQSCHTAVSTSGYVFEGHVPAWVIAQFLAKPPKDAKGLAVPGMPMGTAGMENGNQFTPFDVLLLKKDGSAQVYAHIATIEKAK